MEIAKRPRKGPFNSILDPSEYKAGSGMVGLSEAVKSSGTHDAWAPEVAMDVLPDGMETVQKKIIKVHFFFYLTGTITDLGLATNSKVYPGHYPGPRNRRAAPGDVV